MVLTEQLVQNSIRFMFNAGMKLLLSPFLIRVAKTKNYGDWKLKIYCIYVTRCPPEVLLWSELRNAIYEISNDSKTIDALRRLEAKYNFSWDLWNA